MSLNFARFYDQHVKAVYRFIYFRVGQSKEVAEDLTSDVFMSAFQSFDKYDPERSQKAWIMTIARHKLINHWRDKKEHVDLDEIAFALPGEDGGETAEKNQEVDELKKALGELKSQEKILIEHKYLLGYRYAEIGKILGKTAGAVRVETHRAMKKLQGLLKGKL